MLRDIIDVETEQESDKWLEGSYLVSDRRVFMTQCVVDAWDEFHRVHSDLIIKTFRILGLFLPIGGSEDHVLSIKGIPTEICQVGNWKEELPPNSHAGSRQRGSKSQQQPAENLNHFVEPST